MIKKIGIITFHNAKNYGAILQSYALCKFINNEFKNTNAEVINYKCKYLEDFYNPKLAFGDSLKGKIKRVFAKTKLTNRNTIFDEFVMKNIPLSKEYDKKNVKDSTYDTYIAGSDMLWHWHETEKGTFFDDNYFLGFVTDSFKKNSYAASFGTNDIPKMYNAYYERMLRDFRNISVREESGVKLVNKLIGNKAECHVDPTLLIKVNEWRKIEQRPTELGYVLVYEVGSITESMLESAKSIAKKKNKKLVILLSEYEPFRSKGIFGYSPNEFLGWFDNADYVITNSFHGLVFSIIYHKQFLVEVNSWIINNRAMELMKRLNLDNRIIAKYADIDEVINWSNVDKRLDRMRLESKEYLNEVINGVK